MELPGFFNKVVVDAELDVVVEFSAGDGFRLMASRGDYVLVHAWKSLEADTLDVYESVSAALKDNLSPDGDTSTFDTFVAEISGDLSDDDEVSGWFTISEDDARDLLEWLSEEAGTVARRARRV